jgi:hypothetical protein
MDLKAREEIGQLITLGSKATYVDVLLVVSVHFSIDHKLTKKLDFPMDANRSSIQRFLAEKSAFSITIV